MRHPVQKVFVFILLIGLHLPVGAAEPPPPPPLLAITDLRMLGSSASVAEAQAFSEFIRTEIEKTGLYRVLSRNSMLAILKAQKFDVQCHEISCFLRMGRILDADQILAGHLQRQGDDIEITLRLIDIQNGRFLRTLQRDAPKLTTQELMGGWGLQLIADAFQIDYNLLSPAPGEGAPVETQPAQIPDEVLKRHPGMIYIPAGEVTLGSSTGDRSEYPPHKVFVPAFYIDKYEVTNAQYKEFVDATGHRTPPHWQGGLIAQGMEKHPVIFIAFADAEAYCEWRGGRLPTEAEWERAAKGSHPWVFPWGDTFDPNRANTWEAGRKDTAPIGSYPFGASPFGVEDMAGNVFEWVDGFFEPYPGGKRDMPEYEQHLRILRGGSWNFNEYYARTTHRFARSGGEITRTYGFRMVRDAASAP